MAAKSDYGEMSHLSSSWKWTRELRKPGNIIYYYYFYCYYEHNIRNSFFHGIHQFKESVMIPSYLSMTAVNFLMATDKKFTPLTKMETSNTENASCKYWFPNRTWHCGVRSNSLVETSSLLFSTTIKLSFPTKNPSVMRGNWQFGPVLNRPFSKFIWLKRKFSKMATSEN